MICWMQEASHNPKQKRCLSFRAYSKNAVHTGELTAEEITSLIEAAKTSKQEQPIEELVTATQTKTLEKAVQEPKAAKDVNGYLKTARNALRHAENAEGEADFKLLGEIKALVRSIEKSLD